jgi:circadian clock protein KaiB
VDVFKEQRRALEDRVFMTPTLIKLGPSPMHRIVGTLSQTPSVLQILGFGTLPA